MNLELEVAFLWYSYKMLRFSPNSSYELDDFAKIFKSWSKDITDFEGFSSTLSDRKWADLTGITRESI